MNTDVVERVDWMVQLACSSHWRTLCRLRLVCYDTRRSLNQQSRLRPTELPDLPTHYADHAYPWLHQQYANEVDCAIQFRGIVLQYRGIVHCYNSHTCCYEQRSAGASEIYKGEHGLG